MKNWEIHEQECCDYLNRTFGSDDIRFDLKGGSDSTQSDIIVKKKDKTVFCIDAKMEKAQCAQFVLSPNKDTNTFIFSSHNRVTPTENSNEIINVMNSNFTYYSSSRNVKDLPNDNESVKLYSKWIVDCYKQKNARFFICKKNENFIIIPISKLLDYFNISGVYRVKKSGSSTPPVSKYPAIEREIRKLYPQAKFSYCKKAYFVLNICKPIPNISIDEYTYFFRNEGNKYKIRKLSNTYNSNIIFTITLKSVQHESDLEIFRNELNGN